MKLRGILFAFAVFACGSVLAAGSGYSIFFNDFTESNGSCHIDNLTGVRTSTVGSANLVATTSPSTPLAFVNCGTGGAGIYTHAVDDSWCRRRSVANALAAAGAAAL